MVFQSDLLLYWRTVLDNVLLPVEIKRWDRATHRARAEALLSQVGLTEFAGSIRANCPAACASVSRSAARWCRTRACC